jgi:hypothetical protein
MSLQKLRQAGAISEIGVVAQSEARAEMDTKPRGALSRLESEHLQATLKELVLGLDYGKQVVKQVAGANHDGLGINLRGIGQSKRTALNFGDHAVPDEIDALMGEGLGHEMYRDSGVDGPFGLA